MVYRLPAAWGSQAFGPPCHLCFWSSWPANHKPCNQGVYPQNWNEHCRQQTVHLLGTSPPYPHFGAFSGAGAEAPQFLPKPPQFFACNEQLRGLNGIKWSESNSVMCTHIIMIATFRGRNCPNWSLERPGVKLSFQNITRSSAHADKLHDTFRGQSRSPNIVPFHMLGIVSF